MLPSFHSYNLGLFIQTHQQHGSKDEVSASWLVSKVGPPPWPKLKYNYWMDCHKEDEHTKLRCWTLAFCLKPHPAEYSPTEL